MPTTTKRLRHPYHLKRLYIQWRLRVLKHEHTGKRVHHQHTSYPLLALLLLAVGAVMTHSTLDTYAATTFGDTSYVLNVSAIVPGAVPTEAATIVTPKEGTDFSATPITVTGTCPVKTYVQLFRNDYPSGTALCASDGTYSIETDLFEGSNKLMVRDYNYGAQAGPDSEIRTVTYTLPVTPVTPPITGSNGGSGTTSGGSTGSTGSGAATGSGSNSGATIQPLTLRNDYAFQGYRVGDTASFNVAILGGTAPYSISVAWGDGKTDLYTSKTADSLVLSHAYSAAGPYDGSYRIIVTASDANGNKTTLQIMALVVNVGSASGASSGGSTSGGTGLTIFGVSIWAFIGSLWVTYGAVCLVLLAFWLGEAREIRLIRSRYRLTRL